MELALYKRRFQRRKEGRMGKLNLEMDGREWHVKPSCPVAPEFSQKEKVRPSPQNEGTELQLEAWGKRSSPGTAAVGSWSRPSQR